MDGRHPGESGNIAMFGSQQACNWQNIISICYMQCLNPLSSSKPSLGSPGPSVSGSLSKSPGSDPSPGRVPRVLACGDRGSTGTAKLATVIKLMSCIGLGTRQWQLDCQPCPGPGPRRRTQQARRRPAGPEFKFGRSRYRAAQPNLWH